MASMFAREGIREYRFRGDISKREAGYNPSPREKANSENNPTTNLLAGIMQWLSPKRKDNSNQETK